MRTLELLKKLEKYPVFDIAVFRQLSESKPAYAKLYLYRLKKRGYVFAIMRNKYTVHKEPLVVASRIIWPSYISLWSAIRYYNLTEQLPRDIWVISTRKISRKEIPFGDAKIIFARAKPKYFFGYKKIIVSGFEVFMAEPEKAIIDSVLFRKISFSEIADIIKNNRKNLNINRLADFALETKSKSLIKRLGCLLDKIGLDCYPKFKKQISDSFVPLEYFLHAKGKKDEKWRIIKNIKI